MYLNNEINTEIDKDKEIQEWLGEDNKLGLDIFNNKYRHNNESLDQWLDRVSGGDNELRKLIKQKKFLFGGRVLANRGIEGAGNFFNCFSDGYVPDDMEGIMDTAKTLALTYKSQGGQGISLSNIRPKGTAIGENYDSDGILPFMRIFNTVTEAISMGGNRKGALMMSLDITHKDAKDFITVKTDLNEIQKANLSLEINDEFMEAVEKYYNTGEVVTMHITREYSGHVVEYDIVPIDLYKLMMKTVYDYGEPGCIFTNRFRNYNIMEKVNDYNIVTSNPCFHGDTLILTDNGLFPIKALVGKSVNIWNGYEWSEVEPKVTGENQHCLEITCSFINNPQKLVVTDYHKFILQGNKRVEAKDLNVGDRIETYFIPDKYNYMFVEMSDIQILDIQDYGIVDTVYCFNEPKNHSVVANGILTVQCGEQPLHPKTCCNLGSLNLYEFVKNPHTDKAKFNWMAFKEAVSVAINALDNIIDENIDRIPLEEYRENARKWRNIGLGVMGYADMLMALKLKYGSKKAIEFTNNLFDTMAKEAISTSRTNAITDGAFPGFSMNVWESEFTKKHGYDANDIRPWDKLRNCSLLSIAPTGSIGTMLGRSGGIEPQFALKYTRRTDNLAESYEVNAPVVEDYYKITGKDHSEPLPNYFVVSQDIPWQQRLKTQAVIQDHVDTAISSTVNLPKETTLEEIEQLYLAAWALGLKGITIFRDGCKRLGVLLKDEDKTENKTKNKEVENKEENQSDNKEYDTKSIDKNEVENSLSDSLPRGYIVSPSDDLLACKRTVTTGCGKFYLHADFDEDTGEMLETFIDIGSGGGCERNLQFISRLISAILRLGGTPEMIIDQAMSVKPCKAFTDRTKAKGDTSKGSSCPAAIGWALKELNEKIQSRCFDGDDEDKDEVMKITDDVKEYTFNLTDVTFTKEEMEKIADKFCEIPSYNPITINGKLTPVKFVSVDLAKSSDYESEPSEAEKCPECGADLIHESGCVTCYSCGFSRCG